MLADVGVMVTLLNATGLGIHPELVHALADEYGHEVGTHNTIAEIRKALEGWSLSPTGEEENPVLTTHELWSTLYLRQVAREHAAAQPEGRRRSL